MYWRERERERYVFNVMHACVILCDSTSENYSKKKKIECSLEKRAKYCVEERHFLVLV